MLRTPNETFGVHKRNIHLTERQIKEHLSPSSRNLPLPFEGGGRFREKGVSPGVDKNSISLQERDNCATVIEKDIGEDSVSLVHPDNRRGYLGSSEGEGISPGSR